MEIKLNNIYLGDCLELMKHIGSGTTAIACLNTSRNYIGFELDETYFDVAQKRIEKLKEEEK